MMDETAAVTAFAAMSDQTRLRIVRLLVRAGPDGMASGAIGEAMGGATSSRMAFHLKNLEHAGLVQSRREGRFIIYTAVLPALSGLLEFLMRDCCQGNPEICAPAFAAVACAGEAATPERH